MEIEDGLVVSFKNHNRRQHEAVPILRWTWKIGATNFAFSLQEHDNVFECCAAVGTVSELNPFRSFGDLVKFVRHQFGWSRLQSGCVVEKSELEVLDCVRRRGISDEQSLTLVPQPWDVVHFSSSELRHRQNASWIICLIKVKYIFFNLLNKFKINLCEYLMEVTHDSFSTIWDIFDVRFMTKFGELCRASKFSGHAFLFPLAFGKKCVWRK